jgi:hypothetical protein
MFPSPLAASDILGGGQFLIAASRRSLRAAVRFTPRACACGACAGTGAIALTTVAHRANEDGYATGLAYCRNKGLAGPRFRVA